MKAFDARCQECDHEHVVWVDWSHEEGGELAGFVCTRYNGGCGGVTPHTLVRQLDGLSHLDKWGPDGATA